LKVGTLLSAIAGLISKDFLNAHAVYFNRLFLWRMERLLILVFAPGRNAASEICK
jgi:cytochrome c biogenesis factor